MPKGCEIIHVTSRTAVSLQSLFIHRRWSRPLWQQPWGKWELSINPVKIERTLLWTHPHLLALTCRQLYITLAWWLPLGGVQAQRHLREYVFLITCLSLCVYLRLFNFLDSPSSSQLFTFNVYAEDSRKCKVECELLRSTWPLLVVCYCFQRYTQWSVLRLDAY